MTARRRYKLATILSLCTLCLCGVLSHSQPNYEQLAAKAQRGKEAMAAGRFEEAAAIYGELVKVLPTEPGMLMNLGVAQFMAGQPQKAVRQFESVSKLQPDLVQAWLFLGASHLQLNHPEKAIPALEKVIGAQPDHTEARQMLGDACLSVAHYEQAAQHYQQLSKQDPSNPKAWYGLGRAYESIAAQAFEKLERTAPESGYWLALIGQALSKQQKYSNAFYFYRQALEKLPSLRGIHAALAEIYRATGHPDWAAVEEEKERGLPSPDCRAHPIECDFFAGRHENVLKASSGNQSPEAGYWLAQAANALAVQAFYKLAQLPDSVELHQFRAETYRAQGRHREAVAEWENALKLSPGNPRLRQEMALSLYLGNQHDAARAIVEELLKSEPASAELNFLYGDILLQQQQVEKAIPLLKTAIELDPKFLSAHSALGRAYLQIGQAEQAIPHLRSALETDEDGSLHYQLARAYQSTNQPEPARQALAKYQELQQASRAAVGQLKEEMKITPP